MLYLPVLYYPTKKEDRATGFLMPTYGASTLRGQSIHNAFFWAIDRSQDATIDHDWYSKTGQGVGGEYRYNFGAGDDGNITTYLLEPARDDLRAEPTASTSTLPAERELRASAAAPIRCCRSALRARAQRQLLLEHRDVADVQHEHLRRVAQPAHVRRQRRRRVGQVLAERHARPQRVLLRPDQLGAVAAAGRGSR